MCACYRHARYTDGETGGDAYGYYLDAHYTLLGRQARHLAAHPERLAWARAEALGRHLARVRSWTDIPASMPSDGTP